MPNELTYAQALADHKAYVQVLAADPLTDDEKRAAFNRYIRNKDLQLPMREACDHYFAEGDPRCQSCGIDPIG